MTRATVFLDRDGVLIADRGLLTRADQLQVLSGVPRALARLKAAGLLLIVVSNQSVVARGLVNEEQLAAIHVQMSRLLETAGAPPLDALYVCPHHPHATLPQYRMECDCRKPRPGALVRAAHEHDLSLAASYLVGDRITDIAAGLRAGCTTVLVESPATAAAPIVTPEAIDRALRPDHVCTGLDAAADWILGAIVFSESHSLMKAMVLCAGYGTRLGQLVEALPKPMLPLAGRPLLEYILRNLARHGFDEIAVNLHFHPAVIRDYFGDGSRLGIRLLYSEEPELLGTAGSVKKMAQFLAGPQPFLVHYGDVVTDQDFTAMLRFHRQRQALATLLVHSRERSNSVVGMDAQQRIVAFLERPAEQQRNFASTWVNSGISICDPALLHEIAAGAVSDLPRDIYPKLVSGGRLYAFPLTGYRCAVDSPARLDELRNAAARGILPMTQGIHASGDRIHDA